MNYQFDTLFTRLKNSPFRARFKLSDKDKLYIQQKGIDTIRAHCQDFVQKRLAPAIIPNDGKQTPMRGYDGFWWPLDELVFALDSGAMSQDTLKCILENQNFHLKDDFVIALVHRMIEHKLPEDFILKLIHHLYCCLPSPMVQMILEAVAAKKSILFICKS